MTHLMDKHKAIHYVSTVNWEYFAGSKEVRAKYSMSFNFVNLACVRNYFNPEILIHRVFPLRTHGKKQSMAVYKMESCMQGYHVYEDIWATMIKEDLLCEREPFNDVDRYAIAVLKDDTIVRYSSI